ncbi:MAG: helix-turn-helix transcriptional regulator [Actinobacteria bacterium]|nr:helix-turn-helix transcriptional regulator [Actinomycetota bacterium]MBI3688319.1 helix-turn-helix transcriptional regulator [Actinomycetota bacterium]
MTNRRPARVYTARGPVEGEDWQAVAAALNDRMAARRIGQQELAHLSGVSVSTLRQLQHGAGRRVQNKTLAAISRALAWPEGHLAAVLLTRRSAPAGSTTGAERPAVDEQVLTLLHQLERRMAEVGERLALIEHAIRDHRAR